MQVRLEYFLESSDIALNLAAWLANQLGNSNEALDLPLADVSRLDGSDEREWLITNGLGSYASGTIFGANTRKYHGLLVAALSPPTGRRVLLSRIDEEVNGEQLGASLWNSGHLAPRGFEKIGVLTNARPRPYRFPLSYYKNQYVAQRITGSAVGRVFVNLSSRCLDRAAVGAGFCQVSEPIC